MTGKADTMGYYRVIQPKTIQQHTLLKMYLLKGKAKEQLNLTIARYDTICEMYVQVNSLFTLGCTIQTVNQSHFYHSTFTFDYLTYAFMVYTTLALLHSQLMVTTSNRDVHDVHELWFRWMY